MKATGGKPSNNKNRLQAALANAFKVLALASSLKGLVIKHIGTSITAPISAVAKFMTDIRHSPMKAAATIKRLTSESETQIKSLVGIDESGNMGKNCGSSVTMAPHKWTTNTVFAALSHFQDLKVKAVSFAEAGKDTGPVFSILESNLPALIKRDAATKVRFLMGSAKYDGKTTSSIPVFKDLELGSRLGVLVGGRRWSTKQTTEKTDAALEQCSALPISAVCRTGADDSLGGIVEKRLVVRTESERQRESGVTA
nr:hypothetical protein Iba_chr13bCG7670 [Ipomoea batatas]